MLICIIPRLDRDLKSAGIKHCAGVSGRYRFVFQHFLIAITTTVSVFALIDTVLEGTAEEAACGKK